MGQTNPNYPVMQMIVSILNNRSLASGHERTQEGDIISVRKLGRPAMGFKEIHDYLWLYVQGLEENKWTALARELYDPVSEEEEGVPPHFDKRRFCVPLARLKRVVPSLDLARVRDRADIY